MALRDNKGVLRQRVHIRPFAFRPSAESGSSGLSEYVDIFWRRKRIIFAVALLATVAAFLLSFPDSRIYRARSTLEFQLPPNAFPIEKRDLGMEEDPYIHDQLAVMQSRPLVERVVRKLMAERGGNLARRRRALQAVTANFNARLLPGTRIVEIYCESSDAALASAFSKTLAAEYVEHIFEQRRETTQRTGESLSRELETLRSNLEKSERQHLAYAREHGLVYTGDEESAELTKLGFLDEEFARARALAAAAEAALEDAKSERVETLVVSGNPRLREHAQKLLALRRELREMSDSLTAGHPRMQKAEDQVSAIEAEIGEEQARVERRLAADHQAAARHAQLIGSAYAAQKRLVADRRIRAGQFENLKATVDSNRALYNGLLQRVKETSFGLDPQATNVQIVEAVQTSPVPGHYGRVVYTVRGLLGGLVIGIALALFVERSDRSFKSPGEAVNWTGLPELGAIPRVVSVPLVDDRQSWLSRLLDRKRHAEPGEERSLDRRGAADEGLREAFRSLLASVVCQGRRGACPRVIVFTSPAPQSGTTLVAANLGSAAAEAGQRVLLIDANLRHPELHNLFGLESNLGLSDLLRERFPMPDQPIDAIVEKTLIPGLYVLPAGAATTDVPGLLNAGRMLDLLNRVRREFDFALIDTAAVLSVCDARILGRISDGVVLVARAGHTTHEHLLAAAQILLEDGTPVIGTVLDDWRPNRANPFARVRLAEAEFASGTVPA